MAKYLDTQEISANISRIIKEAKRDLIIISPFLKVNEQIRDLIKGKSKISNLLSIKIVYGKTEISSNEKNWLNDIEDLKLLYKKNLHAKCYINENEAIITSMNLHEFSQQNNIEMGILISKKEDSDLYYKLNSDVEIILGTSERIKNVDETKKIIKEEKKEEEEIKEIKLDLEQKKLFEMIKHWRYEKSKVIKQPTYTILKNDEIKQIVSINIKQKEDLKKIKGIADKKINSFGKEIIEVINDSKNYILLKIINTHTQYDTYEGYDKVEVEYLDTNEKKWLDTIKPLPNKNKLVAAKVNGKWFNDYLYLDN